MPRPPLTDAEKDHLRKLALERNAQNAKSKKEKAESVPGNPPAPGVGNPGAGRVPPAGGPGPGTGGAGAPPPGPGAGGPGGGGSPAGNGGRIPKIQKPLEIVVDKNRFLDGLPSLVKLHMKAGANLIKLWNILPLPLKLEIEDLSNEEAELVSDAVKPGLSTQLPNLGKTHPFGMMIYAFAVTIVAKIKARWVGFAKKNKPPIDVTPDSARDGQ